MNTIPRESSVPKTSDEELHELLTADEVAALLRVTRGWVYEHTRTRAQPGGIRLPFLKIGKYVRFSPRAIAELLRKSAGTA